jgi:PTH1 family peptidyl-tRNA hydrolase
MKLIVGLGNPGFSYKDSRHNVGFSVVKLLGKQQKTSFKKELSVRALTAKFRVEGIPVLLAMPLTYMNLSGEAVSALCRKHRIENIDVLVVLDDLDLELGRVKVKPSGSSAGHRGMQSIIEALGSSDIARLRIGIGRPPDRVEASEYVLTSFNKSERAARDEALEDAAQCCLLWATSGTTKTMNTFNKSASKALRTSAGSILSERSETKETK